MTSLNRDEKAEAEFDKGCNCDDPDRPICNFDCQRIHDVKAFREALEQIGNVLGSGAGSCSECKCEGCEYELWEAARIARAALAGEEF